MGGKRLFDDLVGAGEDRWRDRQAERFGGYEIDDQLECRRLLDRKIGRLGALEDFFPRKCRSGDVWPMRLVL